MNERYYSLRSRLEALAWTVLFLTATAGGMAPFFLPRDKAEVVFAFALGGVLFLFLGMLLMRRAVTAPLARLAHGIKQMLEVGRLVKLPVTQANELGTVAAGFNRLAEQVEEQKQRLREHITELQRVNAELDRLANFKDDLLVTINHQLRTPLTALLEGLELLHDGAMGAVTPDQAALVGTMSENAVRLANLVEQVLDLSLLKSGRRLLTPQPADLGALLRRACETWQAAAEGRRVTLTCGELPAVYMDAEAIQEVLDHLLRNALRHAPMNSEVALRAEPQDGHVEIAVRDGGPGLSAEQLAKLFEPFTHLHTPDAPGSQGSGLGLAFCRQVVERHRGVISAQSQPQQGTTIRFTLPVASVRFLFEEACRAVHDDSEFQRGLYALLVAAPARPGPDAVALMRRAEALLKRNVHHGDRFVRLDDARLVITAVTDEPGLEAMLTRLRGALAREVPEVGVAGALYPHEGDQPDRLLDAACRRFAEHYAVTPHTTIPATLVGAGA